MSYSSPGDLTKLLPEREILSLAEDIPNSGLSSTVVQGVLTEAIDQADKEIDAYVGLVAEVPVNPVPGLLANFSAQMAVCNLYRRRGEVPEAWDNQYKACLRTLTKITERKLSLGQQEEEPQNAPGKVKTFQAEPKLFGNLGRVF